MKNACAKPARAERVLVYSYGGQQADSWWQQIRPHLPRFDNLQLFKLAKQETEALASLASRNLQLSVNILEGEVNLSDGNTSLSLAPRPLRPA